MILARQAQPGTPEEVLPVSRQGSHVALRWEELLVEEVNGQTVNDITKRDLWYGGDAPSLFVQFHDSSFVGPTSLIWMEAIHRLWSAEAPVPHHIPARRRALYASSATAATDCAHSFGPAPHAFSGGPPRRVRVG
jgi:hypothetical protein